MLVLVRRDIIMRSEKRKPDDRRCNRVPVELDIQRLNALRYQPWMKTGAELR
jgi:hypothetical protein